MQLTENHVKLKLPARSKEHVGVEIGNDLVLLNIGILEIGDLDRLLFPWCRC